MDALPMPGLSINSTADVDMNVVMTSSGRFVEIQRPAEGAPYSRGEFDERLSLVEHGIAGLLDVQAELLPVPPPCRDL